MTDRSSNAKNKASRPSNRKRLAMGLAAGLTTMALVTPTAIARPAGPTAGAALAHSSHASSSVSTTGDWSDAAIGVGAGLAITALAGLGFHVRRRVPVSAPSAVSTS